LALTWAAVAVKLTVVCPVATVAPAGKVRFELLLLRVTANPLPDAAWLIVMLQATFPGVLTVPAHVNPVSWVETVRLKVAVTFTPP
jgi:hypothetical protein